MLFIHEPLKQVQNSFVAPDAADFAALFEHRHQEFPSVLDNTSPPRVWSAKQLEISAAVINEDETALRLALRKPGSLNDAEISLLLTEQSADDMGFFWNNRSSWSYEELQFHYCCLMPSVVANKDNPTIFCGYHHEKRTSKSVVKGIFCQFNNIRSIPTGYDTAIGGYYQDTPLLPRLLALDIDQNIFGEEKPADIFETHDIPRPFFTSENPITSHCHAVYEIKYNADEWINWKRTSHELNAITKELTRLLGADPSYNGHVIRSPWFITGFHKNKPASDTGNLIDINNESTYHRSVFYEPHAYTLAELRELIVYLKALHGEKLNHQTVGRDLETLLGTNNAKEQGAAIPLANDTNSRNVSIFNKTRHHAYKIAYQYSINNFDTFVNVLMAYASGQNCFSTPLPTYELRATCKSIAQFCLTKNFQQPRRQHDHSSALQSLRSRRRWGYNYETNAMKAAAEGISKSTLYRRQKLENARSRERRASSVIALMKKFSGDRRDADVRIVYKNQPVLPVPVFIPLIKKGYCHSQTLELADVMFESTGPPFR